MGTVTTEPSGAPEEAEHPGVAVDEHGDAHPVFEGETKHRVTAEVVKNGETTPEPQPATVENARALEAMTRDVPQIWQADPKQLKLLKSVLVPEGITDDQFELFVLVAKRLNLDPFKRQIYAVPYRKNGQAQMVIQTGIDGYRACASRVRDPRTGETLYDGQDPAEWADERGNWSDVWTDKDPPEAARVAVWRKGISRPFVGVARYKSYVKLTNEGKPRDLWATMPDVMLAKCAEALAIRKAFPDELGGVYTVEEMEQAENDRRAADAGPYESPTPKTAPKVPTVALNGDQQKQVAKAWHDATPEAREAALTWMRAQGFTGDSPRVQAVDRQRVKDKKDPLSASGKVFSHFNFDGTPEQLPALLRILEGLPAEEPTVDEAFDPDAVAAAHGETSPPDAV